MIKYASYDIVFREIPDEVTLAINITRCPCRCEGCHSPHLWGDLGDELTTDRLDVLIGEYDGLITCVCLMGGDADTDGVYRLMEHVRQTYPDLHTAWYSGRKEFPGDFRPALFDYAKIGPYMPDRGPLDKPTTNQRLYRIDKGESLCDITASFWRK